MNLPKAWGLLHAAKEVSRRDPVGVMHYLLDRLSLTDARQILPPGYVEAIMEAKKKAAKKTRPHGMLIPFFRALRREGVTRRVLKRFMASKSLKIVRKTISKQELVFYFPRFRAIAGRSFRFNRRGRA